MSYCALVNFRDGAADDQMEWRNSWGGSAAIWTYLFDKYVEKRHAYDNWMGDEDGRLWALAKDPRLTDAERNVLRFTFDNALVFAEDFPSLARDLREVGASIEGSTHLESWAAHVESLDALAVGLHGTSVSENPWFTWDEESEETVPYRLEEARQSAVRLHQIDERPVEGLL